MLKDLKHLSNKELETQLLASLNREKNAQKSFIITLYEVYRRKWHLQQGYSSLAEYCMQVFQLSSNQAWKRAQAVRAVHICPHLLDDLLEDRLSTSHLSILAPHLTPDNSAALRQEALNSPKSALEQKLRQASQTGSQPETICLQFYLDAKSHALWQEYCTAFPNNTPTQSFLQLLRQQQPQAKQTAPETLSSSSRYIPQALRTEIWQAAEGQCQYLSPEGRRCTSHQNLEIDHIIPFAKGGRTELSNLRLLCRAHNQLVADQAYTRAKMDTYRQAFPREADHS